MKAGVEKVIIVAILLLSAYCGREQVSFCNDRNLQLSKMSECLSVNHGTLTDDGKKAACEKFMRRECERKYTHFVDRRRDITENTRP